jgi:hypothetical protein
VTEVVRSPHRTTARLRSKAVSHPGQLVSYRSLAGIGTQNLRKVGTAAPPLYHQILSWKKTAHEGLSDFAPDEKEIVDYVLSFLSDEKEIAYVRQHLRRFVSTIERVPESKIRTTGYLNSVALDIWHLRSESFVDTPKYFAAISGRATKRSGCKL